MPLWFTHYGSELLRVLRFGNTTNIDGLKLIESNLQQLGYELKTERVDTKQISPTDSYRDGFKDYVYSIASMN